VYDCCLVVKVTIATLAFGTGGSSGGRSRPGAVAGGQLIYPSGKCQRMKRMMSSMAKTTEILDGCNMCLGRNDLAREGEL